METIRVHTLARELGLSAQALLTYIREEMPDLQADTVMSHVPAERAERLRASLMEGEAEVAGSSDLFGELRGIFDAAPSEEVFDDAMRMIAVHPDEEVIGYARDIVSRWPGEVARRVPRAWIEKMEARPHAALVLCNAVSLEGHAGVDDDAVRAWCASGAWAGLEHIDLTGCDVSDDTVSVILEALPGLRALDLSGTSVGARGLMALATPGAAPRLARAALRGLDVSAEVFDALRRRGVEVVLDGARGGQERSHSVPLRLGSGTTVWPLEEGEVADELGARVEALGDPDPMRAAEAARDVYFASRRERAPAQTLEALREAARGMEAHEPVEVGGLEVSWHPTGRFRRLRFLAREDVPGAARRRFHALEGELEGFVGAFVDPAAFDARTFENILPLDVYFEGAELAFEASSAPEPGARLGVFGFTPSEDARRALLGLDGLGVYDAPLNDSARGGLRFVFHAAALSQALTEWMRQVLPPEDLVGFSHVNPVFRCNRFSPGDARFGAHLDTPYRDAARRHVSRRTLLLYLTGGRGEPALAVEGVGEVDEVDAMTCVLLDQSLVHEGGPYVEGDKVFVRTELIYEVDEVGRDPAIGALFSKAVYMTGACLVFPELTAHRDACYALAARAHWSGDVGALAREPWLHKTFRGVEFVTNGYDFWCSSERVGPKEAAVLAVLDRLNAQVGRARMRALCDARVVEGEGPGWVQALLAGPQPSEPEGLSSVVLRGRLCAPPARTEGEETCCPFHCRDVEYRGDTFDARRSPGVRKEWAEAARVVRPLIEAAPVWIMGDEVHVDLDMIVVQDGLIHVGVTDALTPVNFAACWNSEEQPRDFIDEGQTVHLPHLLVPPIMWREVGGCHHLRLDLWRNDWWVDPRSGTVPLPAIARYAGMDGGWHRAFYERLHDSGFGAPGWLRDEAEEYID